MTAIFQSVPISNNPPKGGNRGKATTQVRIAARLRAKLLRNEHCCALARKAFAQ
jgi:hypothetical protein